MYTELPPPNVTVTNTKFICEVILSLPEVHPVNSPVIKTFSMYPNPINTTLTVMAPKLRSHYQIRVVNTLGIVLLTTPAIEGKNAINVSKLPAGIYEVQVLNPSRIVYSERVIRL